LSSVTVGALPRFVFFQCCVRNTRKMTELVVSYCALITQNNLVGSFGGLALAHNADNFGRRLGNYVTRQSRYRGRRVACKLTP
jgi:hypothetical protein